MSNEFFAQYKDVRWQKLSAKIKERDEWSCQRCYDAASMLAVHHKHYVRDRKVWEYTDTELVTLCESCHQEMHQEIIDQKMILARLHNDGPRSVCEAFNIIYGWSWELQKGEGGPAWINPKGVMWGAILSTLQEGRWSEDQVFTLLKALERVDPGTVREILQQIVDLAEKKADA